MAVPVVNNFTVNDSAGAPVTSIDLTEPTGVASGDTLIIHAMNDDTSSTAQWDDSTNKPTGFTLINTAGDTNTDAHCASFFRVSDGTEGDPITLPAANSNELIGWYIRMTGAHATTPLHVVGADYLGTSASTTHAVTSLTTTINDCLIFYLLSADGGDTSPYSVSGTGWTESDENSAGGGGQDAGACWGTRELASFGASGDATVTFGGFSDTASAFQFSIRPAVAVTGQTIYHLPLIGVG